VILVLWQTLALALQVGAVLLAFHGHEGSAGVGSVIGFAIAFASALWVLTRPHLTTTHGQPWPGGTADAWTFTAVVSVR
jgi:hypothetical protein